MRTVYASVLDLVPPPAEKPAACFRRLTDVAAAWLEDEYRRGWHVTFRPAVDGTTARPAPDHVVRCGVEAGDACELLTVEWEHPGEDGSDLRWATAAGLARYGQALQLSVAVRLASSRAVVKPLTYDVRRPQLIDAVLAAVPCRVGPHRVPTAPTLLTAATVSAFVHDVLLAADRPLPVVVISVNSWSGHEVEPAVLQRELLGLAHVAALQDKDASFPLSDAVGRELSCYDGAVRLYWPGLTRGADPHAHPLHFPESIRKHALTDQPLPRHLARQLAGIAAVRFAAAPLVRDTRDLIDRRKQQQAQLLLEQAKADGSGLGEIAAALEQAWDEVAALKRERDQVRAEAAALATALATELAARPAAADTPASVADVVARARQAFPDTLHFLDTAVASAADSPYLHPDKVWRVFEVLDELVRQWRADGRTGTTWKELIKQKTGFDYKPAISVTTRNMYGKEYTFTYGGQPRLFEAHVTVGVGPPDRCLSVHWYRDEGQKRLAVGWCGRHRRNTLS